MTHKVQIILVFKENESKQICLPKLPMSSIEKHIQ